MARKKQWHELTKASRDRAARQAAEQYGLTRRQARERYNRGTWSPFSRDPVKQIPLHAPRYPVKAGRDLKTAAIKNMDTKLGDYIKYKRESVINAIEHHASIAALTRMAGASEDELRTWASWQRSKLNPSKPESDTPYWLRNLGWYNDDNEWQNIFWYH
jgi:hypothetical protein